jgi:hypothetical protein
MEPLDNPAGHSCPDCKPTRRALIRAGVGMAAVASITRPANLLAGILPAPAAAAPEIAPDEETLVQTFFKSLTTDQKSAIAFPFDDPLRSKVNNNWMITKKSIAQFLTPDQQAMVRQIFIDMHSEEYADRVMKQVEHDNDEVGGFGGCSVAVFGQPGESNFEFVFTGRHVTRRCDGNSVKGVAFGGPIFYGHAAEGFNETAKHPGNIYWYQAVRANQLYQALDARHRAVALRDDPRREQGTKTVALTNSPSSLRGLPVSELAGDQKQLMREVMADLLAPFRKADCDKAMKLIEDGGFEQLHLSFFKNDDIGNDGVWDLWQVEGPSMVWYFRGAPHVHTWVNIREPEAKV